MQEILDVIGFLLLWAFVLLLSICGALDSIHNGSRVVSRRTMRRTLRAKFRRIK